MSVLVLNAGSSSLKYAVFRGVERVLAGKRERLSAGGHTAAVHELLGEVRNGIGDDLAAVGHRVVHGGDRFRDPISVSDAVLAELEQLIPLARLHEPHNIAGIRAVAAALPDVPQVACFDTAFHAAMPTVERMFGLPRKYYEAGVKRYGFHGLAYESVIQQLRSHHPDLADGRVIACHLGNGASLCAIRGGRSVATTMSFTPLDGLLMGTRPGSLDPGVVLYLERQMGMTPGEVDDVLEHQSGLLGVSGGLSSDLRDLLASPEPAAAEAVDLFCHRIVRELGAAAAVLEGVDAITFSGGIGENSAVIRQRIGDRLGWLGVKLDPPANSQHLERISSPESRVAVLKVAVDEEAVIAQQTAQLLGLTFG